MTALSEYQRLECLGLWREYPEDQRRDVIVSFGDATLVIREVPSDRALSHWSLPAVIRTNPGQVPALFSPGEDSEEELEVEDETMVAAISKVHAIIAGRQPHPGRLRGVLLLTAAAAIAAAAFFWLPKALIAHTAGVLPDAARRDIGMAILGDLQRLTGSPCKGADGMLALDQLSGRLLGPKGGRVIVVPEGIKTAIHLPGNLLILGRHLIEDHDGPEVAAGFILAERLRASLQDPLPTALSFAGLRASFHLLTTGDLTTGTFHGYGETLVTTPPTPLADEFLLRQFAVAGVGSSAYAYALDPSGETTLGLIEADPFASNPPEEPLLNDTDWVALQGICSG
jgi:hypothetical protein